MDHLNPEKSFWWQHPKAENLVNSSVHGPLIDQVRSIEENQYAIAKQAHFNYCMYANRELPGVDWQSHQERAVNYAPVSYTAENLSSSVIETISGLLARANPKPTPVVKDASFKLERQAAYLDKYLYGKIRELDVLKKLNTARTDSMWAPIGALKVDFEYDENDRPVDIFVERVQPTEIIVDERGARGCRPLQMYQRKLVPRETLKQMYPDRAAEIEMAQKTDGWMYTSYRSPGAELLVVVEAWRLPFMGNEGRHVIAVEGCTLIDEEYKRDCFPFVFLRWVELEGFYARPLQEELAPFQMRHNELNLCIRLCVDHVARPRLFIDQGTKLSVEQLDNSIAKAIRFSGTMPQMAQWQAAGPELYAERERNKAGAFEQGGISQMSAQSKLPDNVRLDSSKALREWNLIENQRFYKQAKADEQAVLEIAKHIMELSSILYKGGINQRSKFVNRSVVEEIDWSMVHELVEEGSFALQIEASSMVNSTPAAREDTINTWIARGWIPPERGMALLGAPDLEEEMELLSADVNDVKRVLELLDMGADLEEFPTPTPYQNLELLSRMAHLTYLKRRGQKDVPPEVLENYEVLISQANAIIQQAEAFSNAAEKQAQDAAMAQQAEQAQLQGNLGMETMTPEGQILPGVATNQQGTPVEGLI